MYMAIPNTVCAWTALTVQRCLILIEAQLGFRFHVLAPFPGQIERDRLILDKYLLLQSHLLLRTQRTASAPFISTFFSYRIDYDVIT